MAITLHSPVPLRLMLRGDFERLGDAYVDGDIAVDGPIEEVLHIGIMLAERLGKSSTMQHLRRIGQIVPRRHSRCQDKADIG